MRRKDREITDLELINEIIQASDCCRIGIQDEDGVYIVPLNFGYQSIGGQNTFYFHCANEGKKLDLLKQHPYVGFELDTGHSVVRGEKGCDFTFLYRSVIGTGNMSQITDQTEKNAALAAIVAHYGGSSTETFSQRELGSVTVLKLAVEQMTGKAHQ